MAQRAALSRIKRGLARLLRDRAGNTLVMIAAALIPMLAMLGGGIDMGRSYLSQSRIQQACDAGVLAARKKLGSQVVTTGAIPADVVTIGNRFFNLNYRDGAYGSENRKFQMTLEPDYGISGVASVDVPTTIMTLFGYQQVAIDVKCEARLSFSNTDVMFVLDTTGSMRDTNPGDAAPKIEILKSVVSNFHAQLEGSKTPGTRIRYGFVPYSTNVNVGYLLKSDWVVDKWSYHGREAVLTSNGPLPTFSWLYKLIDLDVTFLKGATGNDTLIGGSINLAMAGVPAPTPLNLTAVFRGCMEERATYEIDDYSNVDLSKALDLDLDLVPTAGKPETQWRPMLNEISFEPEIWWNGTGSFKSPVVTTNNYLLAQSAGLSACPPESRKLAQMSKADVDAFLATLVPRGSTYHDIGMIWGGRLLSPTGIFAAENANVPGKPTSRNLIFLTDGLTAPLDVSYATYGIEPLDQRRWNPKSPSGGLTLTNVVEKRFSVACNEVKKRNITVWVIGFGTTLSPFLTDCAGPGHFFEASNAAQLNDVFGKIATQLGDLRVTK